MEYVASQFLKQNASIQQKIAKAFKNMAVENKNVLPRRKQELQNMKNFNCNLARLQLTNVTS